MIRDRLPGWLALIWLAVIVVSTVLVHGVMYNPAARDVALALGRAMLDVVAVAGLVTLAGAIGTMFVRGHADFSPLERTALAALLGLGVIGIAVLIVGLLGLFPPTWLAWLILIGLLAALCHPALAWLHTLREALPSLFQPEADPLTRWMGRALLVMLGLSALLALAPPTAWDSLTYHLAGPRFYLTVGRIISYPDNHFLGFPQNVEMLSLWLMILARPQAAALLHGCFGVLTLALVMGVARWSGRPSAGVVAAAALLVSDSLWGEFGWAYNDLAAMAFVTAALSVVLIWDEVHARRRDRLLILAGAFVGLALGTKYTAAGAAIGAGALIVWLSRQDGVIRLLRAGGMVSVVALIVFAPWLIKNALLDGNPLSPFVWGTAAFDRFDQWYYLRPGTGLNPVSLLLAPIQGAIFGLEGYAPYGASSGALLVALLPLAALGWRRRGEGDKSTILSLLIFSLPPYLVWLAGAATSWYLVETRLLFPIFPALALVGGLGLDGLRTMNLTFDPGPLARLLVAGVLALALAGSALAFVRIDPLPVVVGLQGQDAYLTGQLGAHYAAMQQINALPEKARVLFLWEPRTFYCERACVPDSLINRWWHERQIEPDPRQIADRWRAQGITYVLVFEAGLDFLTSEEPYEPLTDADIAALDEMRRESLIPIWDGAGAYTLYELKGTQP